MYAASLDYSLLCCGYLRNIAAAIDIFIPSALWILPKYDMYAMKFASSVNEKIETIAERYPLSAICDIPTLDFFGDRYLFQTISDDLYMMDDDDFMRLDVRDLHQMIQNYEELQKILPEKAIEIKENSPLRFLRGSEARELFVTCLNNGDVVEFDSMQARDPYIQCKQIFNNTTK